jgi:Ca-activated chloride channel family protein
MSFASPEYLALLVLAPLAAAAYLSLARWREAAAGRLAPGRSAHELSQAGSPAMRFLGASLVVMAVAALAVALAGPRLGEREVVVQQAGADVVIALDVSRSMFAGDIAPSRLALAQQETLTLLERLRGHRVGLVVFARSALIRSPLTSDRTPLQALVRSAPQDSALLEPGSDLGAAVRTATRALETGEAESKATILVTDGEDHEGDALAAARDAASRGVLLFAAGVGTEAGAPVPAVDPDTGYPIPGEAAEEAPITSRDEGLLRLMAATSPRGEYVPGENLAGLADAVDRLERTSFVSERRRVPTERFQWAVLAALALLMLEPLLPERRGEGPTRFALRLPASRAAGLGVLVPLALLVAACGSSASHLIDDGNRAYEQEDYQAALEAYLRAGAVSPDRPEPHVNAGLALHRLARYEEAANETIRALPIDDPQQSSQVHYNLGHHYLLQGRLLEAASSFRQALVLNPDDQDAKYNLELVLALIERLPTEGTTDAGEPVGDGSPGPVTGEEGQNGDDVSGPVEEAQRTLAEALAGIEEELTVDQALEALDLAQELNRLLELGEAGTGSGQSDRPDY